MDGVECDWYKNLGIGKHKVGRWCSKIHMYRLESRQIDRIDR